VERFFEALEKNEEWLTTVTPSAWLAGHHPVGRVYVPTGSYAEMGEWALPVDESRAYASLLHAAQAGGRPETRWLRGASWRNFQVKYREVNDLHKQMLRTSAKVDAMVPGPTRDLAIDHLYQGQSNDCYWHGLFGGIYISHMRLATYEHLIAAEDLADAAIGQLHGVILEDVDLDGFDDVKLASPGQVVTVDLAAGAGIGSWDIRPVRHALAAVMRRRPEAYHETLRAHEAALDEVSTATPGRAHHNDASPSSIHDIVAIKEPGLSGQLDYDPYERRSGLVRFLAPDTTADAWSRARAIELGDAVEGPYDVERLELDRLVASRLGSVAVAGSPAQVPATVLVTKELILGGHRATPTLELRLTVDNRSDRVVEARLGLEWTLTMLGGGGNPSAWWEVAGERSPHDSHGTADRVSSLAQGNDYVGVAIATTVTSPATAWWAPVETISNSESGFERVHQGSALLLPAGGTFAVSVRHAVTTTRDGASEEAAPSAAARTTPVAR
jgi:alpha-amylase